MKKLGILFSICAALTTNAFAMSDTPEAENETPAAVAAAPVAQAAHAQHKAAPTNAPVLMMAPAALEALKVTATDHVEGAVNAPITVVEYASLACSHCATFHNEIYPEIKEKYVDTGKVRFVIREMGWGNLATAVAKIIRCVPKEEQVNMLSLFFKTQEKWLHQNQLEEMRKVARLGGLDEDAVKVCIGASETQETIVGNTTAAQQVLGVTATPSFFVGNLRFKGVMSAELLSAEIEKQLQQ